VSELWVQDSSTLNVFGGHISGLMAYDNDNANINIFGGQIYGLYTSGDSTVNISDGDVHKLYVRANTTAKIIGGNVEYLLAKNSSMVNISGGSFLSLDAQDDSFVIFEGYDFILGDGLSWDIDGQTILGTGTLIGNWFDDTSFEIAIDNHEATSTIMAIPEPATLVLLTLGTFAIIKKRKA